MIYENLVLDEERALYGVRDARIIRCQFAGAADGESALKEAGNLKAENCDFELRYPLWHVKEAELKNCVMTHTCRAALWYDEELSINGCEMKGIKALRECSNVLMQNCKIESPEFGWFCHHLQMKDCRLEAEYPFLKSCFLTFQNLQMKGKYSFQYTENVEIHNSFLDTKDAFWHSKNVTVVDSVVKGEYLAWYSEGLKLIRCKIIGTQPLCYAKGLVLEDCVMEDTDLSFENSEVNAVVKGNIVSVKNPAGGRIEADHIEHIIVDEYQWQDGHCEIISKDR